MILRATHNAIHGALLVMLCLPVWELPIWGQETPQEPSREKEIEKPLVTSPYLALIRDPVVQEIVGIGTEEKAAIRQLTDELDGPLWRIRALPLEQNAVKLGELIATAKSTMQQILGTRQQERLEQVVLRAQGVESLLRDDVADRLELTDDQLRRIVETFNQTRKATASLRKKARNGGSRETLDALAKQLQAAHQRKLLGILDADQRRRWLALLGEPYDTSRLGHIEYKAPELDGTDGWIGTRPLRREDLRGKVTALHFWTYG